MLKAQIIDPHVSKSPHIRENDKVTSRAFCSKGLFRAHFADLLQCSEWRARKRPLTTDLVLNKDCRGTKQTSYITLLK